jgi:hypothetical protein
MNNVCISTRFDRYNIFFELWLKNCLNYSYDIVIFLDGHIQQIYDKVNTLDTAKRKIIIYNIENGENIYNTDNLKVFKNIFDILYFELQYETIIYTDPDELLLVNNFDSFLNVCENHLASKGFEMIQYNDENEFDLHKSIIDQRKFGFCSQDSYNSKCSFYDKICVFNKNNYPTTVGRHAYECSCSPIQIENDFIFLIHLRDICTKTMLDNSKENLSKYQKNHNQHSR